MFHTQDEGHRRRSKRSTRRRQRQMMLETFDAQTSHRRSSKRSTRRRQRQMTLETFDAQTSHGRRSKRSTRRRQRQMTLETFDVQTTATDEGANVDDDTDVWRHSHDVPSKNNSTLLPQRSTTQLSGAQMVRDLDLDLGSGQGHINIHSTCRSTRRPNHVTVALHSTEICRFEFRQISILDEV